MIEWGHGGDNMTVGQNIKRIRNEKGITQKKLSELTGIAEVTIRKYESGKIIPKSGNLFKLANGLDVLPSELNEILKWNESVDLTHLQQEANIFDLLITKYGEDTASTINDFLSLNDEGQRKVSDYIDDLMLMQKYRKEK